MESLKKIISLNQASKFSGYSQDYLGYLIRKGEIEGIKKGKTWFTTEEEIKNYIFKKKVRSKKLAIREFFSPSRTKNIIILTIIIFFIGFFLVSNLHNNNSIPVNENHSAVSSDGESLNIPIKQ